MSRSGWQPPPQVRRHGAEPRIPLTPPVAYDADGYPYADGAPMAHGTEHLMQMHYGFQALLRRYRHRPEVCVLSDVFISYRKGDPTAVVAPDMYVAFGACPPEGLSSYKLWEKPVPAFVLEVLSPDPARRDLDGKLVIYEAMGVAEYWVHDPHGRWVEAGGKGTGGRRRALTRRSCHMRRIGGTARYWGWSCGTREGTCGFGTR